ncbi:MAG: anthranilate phosphoribosyltransferase [Candidatus Omnitrophica bacterium]|nr:anthranilate phosphoribosyltransferase [Candidatus Omnitrophota bacterium]
MDIKKAIKKISGFEDLTEEETRAVFDRIMNGETTPAQIGALLIGLHMKGETAGEITGAARVMRERSLKINVRPVRARGVSADPAEDVILDTCGTGGTGKNTFNISTAVAFVVAGCGVKVAKHGNRAASGRCGSADVLEALGVRIDAPAEVTEKCINTINIGFIFAPLFHEAMRHAAGPRKELGVRTIFNLLGPLSNPASATCQVMGVYDEGLTGTMAEVLGKLGVERAYVVYGMDKFDEVAITGKTKVSELDSGEVRSYYVAPADFGIDEASMEDISGGSPGENAGMVRAVLSGEEGPRLDIVLMNSSIALMAAGRAGDLTEGVQAARGSISSGKAGEKLEQLIRMTNG